MTIAEFNKDDELPATIVSLMNKIGNIYHSYFSGDPFNVSFIQKLSIVVGVLCHENTSKYVKFSPS